MQIQIHKIGFKMYKWKITLGVSASTSADFHEKLKLFNVSLQITPLGSPISTRMYCNASSWLIDMSTFQNIQRSESNGIESHDVDG